jgi:alkaline phosphatase
MRRTTFALATALLLSPVAVADESADGWFAAGARQASERIGDRPGQARNLILFVGDGMGVSTVTAARILAGQRRGDNGEEHLLSFERLPYTALSKTYSVNAQVADSAPTMTAMMTGSKTAADMVAVGPGAIARDCESAQDHSLLTLLQLAEIAGMASGVVTTTRVSHATPAATYAHVAYRRWESDAELDVAAREAGCHDVARQLIEFAFGDGPEVVMGGGRSRFTPDTMADPEYPDRRGMRRDGRDLTAEWRARGEAVEYVWNRAQFDAIDPTRTRQLLALFEPEHMRYAHDRAQDVAGEPSLAEMVDKALDLLQQHSHGYVLVIEGGLIDRAHHDGIAARALDETIEMADAVQRAIDRTDPADTLLIVTADHSHPLTISGYARRGNPITGLAQRPGRGTVETDRDGAPFTTLNYADGPGRRAQPPVLSDVAVAAPDYRQQSAIPLDSVTHGGEDVPVYARGPGAHAVRGVIEQNAIYHLLVQNTPRLRDTQCRLAGGCDDADAVTRRPDHGQVLRQYGTSHRPPQGDDG